MKKSTYEAMLDAAEAYAIEAGCRVVIKTRPHKGNKSVPSTTVDINDPAFQLAAVRK